MSSFLWFCEYFHRIILARLDQRLGRSTPVIGCFSVRFWKALWLLENFTWEPNGSLVANVATLKWFSSLTMATIFESNWKHEQKFRKQPQSSETPLKWLVCSTNSLFILTIRIIVHFPFETQTNRNYMTMQKSWVFIFCIQWDSFTCNFLQW